MKDDLVILVEEHAQGPVVKLKGDAGIAGSQTLEQAVTRLCARSACRIVADLSELNMVSSLAMGQLVAAHRAIARKGGDFRLAAVQPLVMSSFVHARLDQVLHIYPTVADAMTS